MKKSFLTFTLSSIFILSACDDKASQKLVESEKKFTQLETDYKKAQSELATKTATLTQVQTALNQVKNNNLSFPTLQVEIVKLFEKREKLKFEKDPEYEFIPKDAYASLLISTAKTQIEWLDALLLNRIIEIWQVSSETETQEVTEDEIKDFFKELYQSLLDAANEYQGSHSISFRTNYLGQRNNIVIFSQQEESYPAGAAHSLWSTKYLNIDIHKQTIITLNDLINPKDHEKLREALWKSYQKRPNKNHSREDYVLENFSITDNFYFVPNGITFVYPLYEIGSFLDGEVEVLVEFELLKDLMKPEYFPTLKDGYGLNRKKY